MHKEMDLKKLRNKVEVKIQKKINFKQKMVEKGNKMSTVCCVCIIKCVKQM